MKLDAKSNRYLRLVMNEMVSACDEYRQCNPKQDNDSWEVLFSNTSNQDKPPTPRMSFVAKKLFQPMSEIMTTIERIENIQVYIKSFPYSRQGISRAAYLKYHVENYLNELYILKERMVFYCTIIMRRYKRSPQSQNISNRLDATKNQLIDALNGYNMIRHDHVHEARFSDPDFERLSALEFMIRHNDDPSDEFFLYKDYFELKYDQAYKDVRFKWINQIKSDLSDLKILLNQYYGSFSSILIRDNAIVFPNGIK